MGLKPSMLIPYDSMIDDRNHFGSAWSLPQRRAGVLSSPAVPAVFVGGAKNTTTQMEIVPPNCLLNSKEYILKKPIWVLRQKCRSIGMISVFLLLFMGSQDFPESSQLFVGHAAQGKGNSPGRTTLCKKTVEFASYEL